MRVAEFGVLGFSSEVHWRGRNAAVDIVFSFLLGDFRNRWIIGFPVARSFVCIELLWDLSKLFE